MSVTKFRKESSERSDATNWAKEILMRETSYYFDSIEGCNENEKNVVTHLMERARVDFVNDGKFDLDVIVQQIIALETKPTIERKINFAQRFGINLSYVLYCNENQHVWLLEFIDVNNLKLVRTFGSYIAFSDWIADIKGWKSSKTFRESADLPVFDKILRQAGCAWPTNIDCFISDQNNQPIGILEFQNAKTTSVKDHCNNEFFLCKQVTHDQWGHVKYHDDIRRWQSQEILRVQSGLRLFVITWAQGSADFILKEIEIITFPELPFGNDWVKTNAYKRDMHQFVFTKRKEDYQKICNNYQSFNLKKEPPIIQKIIFNPPLDMQQKTFPYIYYKFKQLVQGKQAELPNMFNNLITSI